MYVGRTRSFHRIGVRDTLRRAYWDYAQRNTQFPYPIHSDLNLLRLSSKLQIRLLLYDLTHKVETFMPLHGCRGHFVLKTPFLFP